MEAPELADVVLVVEGERFPAHRNVLAALSEYFRGLLLSGMQEGSGQQEIPLGEVSAGAFRVVLRYVYTAAVPAWEELQGTGTSAEGGWSAEGGNGGRWKGGISRIIPSLAELRPTCDKMEMACEGKATAKGITSGCQGGRRRGRVDAGVCCVWRECALSHARSARPARSLRESACV